MRYTVERVEWKDEKEAVCALLARGFPGTPTVRYAWLHERNPAGPAALWLARDADGRPVGTVAVHPHRVLVGGHLRRVGQPTDFVVDSAARAFGPALALQRAVLPTCVTGEFAFLYGFPNPHARAVFDRLGYRTGAAARLARPLRTRGYLERDRRVGRAARLLAVPIDAALRMVARETYRRLPRGLRLERLHAFDDDFDAFWERVRGRYARTVVADRSSPYMNWRYAECPVRRYEMAALRDGGDICATIVWHRIGRVLHVAELLARDGETFDVMLAAFLRSQRRSPVDAVSATLLGDALVAHRLTHFGFTRRDLDQTVVVHMPTSFGLPPGVSGIDTWALFEGDVL